MNGWMDPLLLIVLVIAEIGFCVAGIAAVLISMDTKPAWGSRWTVRRRLHDVAWGLAGIASMGAVILTAGTFVPLLPDCAAGWGYIVSAIMAFGFMGVCLENTSEGLR